MAGYHTPMDAWFAEHERIARLTRDAVAAPFARLVDVVVGALQTGGKLMIFGNGGSAADAQHLATEFVVRLEKDRRPLAALALTTDTSALTAAGNDLGFDHIFSRQIAALGRPGDVALGITTSGRSRNVILALEQARAGGMTAAALAGRDGGLLPGLADPLLVVPADNTSSIQEMHIVIAHALTRAVERAIFGPA